MNISFRNTWRIVFLAVFLLVLYLLPFGVSAQGGEERIEGFDSYVRVQTDGTLFVREEILYNFNTNERHGIYREIPKSYVSPGPGGNEEKYKLIVQNFEVQSPTAPSNISPEHTTHNYSFRVGDPNSTITGTHLYVFSYEVENAIGFYEDFDEVYWNAMGTEWGVPITSAALTVTLPEEVRDTELKSACYEGTKGSRESCEDAVFLNGETGVRFTSKNLLPKEGLTGALGFPKGIVPEIERERFGVSPWLGRIILSTSITLLVVLWFFTLTHAYQNWKKTREPKQTRTIVRQYAPPDNISPSALGYIVDKRVDNQDITAEIVHLAERGFIHILSLPKKTFFQTKPQFYLLKMKPESDDLNKYQKLILSSLFSDSYTLSQNEQNILIGEIQGSKNQLLNMGELSLKVSSSYAVTSLKDLKSKFHVDLRKVKESLLSVMVDEEYIKKFSSRPLIMYVLSSLLIILLTTFINGHPSIESHMRTIITFATFLLLYLTGALAFPSQGRTEKGIDIKRHTLGLKEYLSIAEKDRLDFHFNPKNNPHMFEALLPFAIALQVDTQWAKGLEDLFVTPDWYTDAGHARLNVASLHSSFRSFNSAAASSYASPSSSGSSGGGFSGGGGGGGGGGSW